MTVRGQLSKREHEQRGCIFKKENLQAPSPRRRADSEKVLDAGAARVTGRNAGNAALAKERAANTRLDEPVS